MKRKRPAAGWWFLIVVALIMLAVTVRMVMLAGEAMDEESRRDPVAAAAVLGEAFSAIPADEIIASGAGRDGIPALTEPATVAGSEVAAINEQMHGKFLVSTDRVIGVKIAGEARAYPLNVLAHHVAVNDVLGGRPILVSYDPWCDGAAVFEREIEGHELEFGVSGEVYNSSLLLFNSAADGAQESLWSPLLMQAVCGPAAEADWALTPLHCRLVPWSRWLADNPATSVVSLQTGYNRKYGSNPYGSYFDSGIPGFPVEPMPADDAIPPMARIAAVSVTGHWLVYVYDLRNEYSAGGEPLEWKRDGLVFTRFPQSQAMDPPTISIAARDGGRPPVVYSFWFAWHALHPDGPEPLDATGVRSSPAVL